MKEQETLTWDVMEYQEKDHTVDWYWSVGLVTLAIVIVSIYFKNYLFGILILLGVGTLTYLTIRKPQVMTIIISDKGIRIQNEFFPYRNLRAFWIEEEPQHTGDRHLLVLTDRIYSPVIALPLGDDIPDEIIRKGLLPHMKEELMHDNPAHHILGLFGF